MNAAIPYRGLPRTADGLVRSAQFRLDFVDEPRWDLSRYVELQLQVCPKIEGVANRSPRREINAFNFCQRLLYNRFANKRNWHKRTADHGDLISRESAIAEVARK